MRNTPPQKLAAPPAPMRMPNEVSELSEIVESRLGRALKAKERAVCEAIDALYRRWNGHLTVPGSAMDDLLPRTANLAARHFTLWPKYPSGPLEALIYVREILVKEGEDFPAAVEGVLTEEERAAVLGRWESDRKVGEWQTRIREVLRRQPSARMRRVEVGLFLSKGRVAVRQKNLDTGGWTDCPNSFFSDGGPLAHGVWVDAAGQDLLHVLAGLSEAPRGFEYAHHGMERALGVILRSELLRRLVLAENGDALTWRDHALEWRLDREEGGYRLGFYRSDGVPMDPARIVVPGEPGFYVTGDSVYVLDSVPMWVPKEPVTIPVEALETPDGAAFLQRLGLPLPDDISSRVVDVKPQVVARLWIEEDFEGEILMMELRAMAPEVDAEWLFTKEGWSVVRKPRQTERTIVNLGHVARGEVPAVLSLFQVREVKGRWGAWMRLIGRGFPEEFSAAMEELPEGVDVEVSKDLKSILMEPVKASLKVQAVAGTGNKMDWFDITVALSASDTTLTSEELRILLDARGKFVRIKGKGWRRLELEMTPEDEEALADLGLNPDFEGVDSQRVHALQLSGKSMSRLLSEGDARMVRTRIEDIRTRIAPDVPEGLQADLRAYQREGFQFLAYLSSNQFGGILADDMGLGKTLQTLTWLAWLREQPDFRGLPALVVCPKSVMQNWRSETQRFLPGLRVFFWLGSNAATLRASRERADLLIINYAHLRAAAQILADVEWHAVILDEAQFIKNPQSQTAEAAFSLKGRYRLALSGTPIENRLLDLWSIMQFAMPGVLGARAKFQRQFDSRTDPLARRRLAARVRPFVLRRTKGEVARDLPERTEKDLVVDLDGEQQTLYRAELKRARQMLLSIRSGAEMDKQRFTILSSLLRLRQICCHPGLSDDGSGHLNSSKLEALMDLLEPLMAQGHKVLVFSQFVEMLERIEREIEGKGYRYTVLTGQTEDREEVVKQFKNVEGAAVFLISLRAGGMGLNLTEASYVVLYDPWWNPAVENQAIDRTHRIGQTRNVIAYRLIARDTIEEKIRQLQQSKGQLATDILGEEVFAKALTLDDFRFLLDE
jgi:superfamily II DNA or RNA helicase